ncbi:MAG: adenosine deaminase [Pigmentiphaga sp.]|uniref:adenosine deaminase n=1 Tax=Pigmentiphaga sp. TaxID=1977564 RepID=UPI0029B5381A|nr:adenosine deaminase [Pigmentiphaga sp.]MDX3905850.1 adenosine deaminase [Pigmentiphaga sp.]
MPATRPVPRPHLAALLQAMPKAELHVHIEGTLEPELIFTLARRNGIALPYPDIDSLRRAYAFQDLQSFLDLYYAGAGVLQREEDFYDMAMAYFRRAARDNVVHAEIFFDPQTHTARGIAFGTVMAGLLRARRDARQALGVGSELIMCFLRHLPEEAAFGTLAQAMPYREHIIGVGLDSGEAGNPPEKFAAVFRRCRELGWHAVAHAGEEGPPAYIWSALHELGAERIDHGVRCVEDPGLVAYLAERRIPLTVCPLSNVMLKVHPGMAEHPLAALMKAGLCVTVNSDDPAYFGGYVTDNFLACFEALPELGVEHARQLALNSFEASFAAEADKKAWRRRLNQAFRAGGHGSAPAA